MPQTRNSRSSTPMMSTSTTPGTTVLSNCRSLITSSWATVAVNCSKKAQTARETSIPRRYPRNARSAMTIATDATFITCRSSILLLASRCECCGVCLFTCLAHVCPSAPRGTSQVKHQTPSLARFLRLWRNAAQRRSLCTVRLYHLVCVGLMSIPSQVVSSLDILKIFNVRYSVQPCVVDVL